MGTVLEMSYSIRGAVDGPILGLFILGMVFPCVGRKGAMAGGCVSLLIMLWIVAGSKWHILHHNISYSNLPMTIENCPDPLNETTEENVTPAPVDPENEPMILYRLTFLFFTMFGTLITVVIGLITSFSVGEADSSKVDPDHVTPVIRR